MKGTTQLSKVKQNIHQHKDKSCNLKNTKRQTRGPTELYELFLLTVPIEEVARCQYKTVLIIFPLNLHTITITLNVVKWRTGGTAKQNTFKINTGKSNNGAAVIAVIVCFRISD